MFALRAALGSWGWGASSGLGASVRASDAAWATSSGLWVTTRGCARLCFIFGTFGSFAFCRERFEYVLALR